MTLISLKDITKSYLFDKEHYQVLKGINLEIQQGEFLSIVGPSGSGKSTLLKIMGLLDTPTSGSIKIDKMDCSQIGENKQTVLRRDFIGFIFQSYNLLPDFTALENVVLPQNIMGISTKKAIARAKKLFDELNIENKLHSYPNQLSGGEQQRIAIARSLINKPKIILADEPTGNLDTENKNNIAKILEKISKEHKITTVVVTHDMNIAKNADKIYCLNDGKLEIQK
ncbi:ABC transporter ATP-binding protein [Candidatus Bandiella numerosa]|uniref:ABC transporter ATP-binding protein n=1 Tax=Candidatus Bandiella numerosa TaxID=2570586 RepID=UPI001F264B95